MSPRSLLAITTTLENKEFKDFRPKQVGLVLFITRLAFPRGFNRMSFVGLPTIVTGKRTEKSTDKRS